MAVTAALAGLSFLIIGESHMLYKFPDFLHQDLYAQGAAHVHTIGACGASAGDWIKPRTVDCGAEKKDKEPTKAYGPTMRTQPIRQLLDADKPDVIVVIIGDTMGSYANELFPKAWAWQSITSLTKAIAASKTTCVWVGPAWGQPGGKYDKNNDRVERAVQFLSRNVAPCTYVNSLDFAKPGQWRTFDGQHFKDEGYEAWSKAIVGAIGALPSIRQLEQRKK